MQYHNDSTMMSQMYVQLYDIPQAGYEGSDSCKFLMNDKAWQGH
jgi:hypothetical protein